MTSIARQKRWACTGYAILFTPHNEEEAIGVPGIISLECSEYDAFKSLIDHWECCGDEFFYWIAPIEYTFKA